MGSRYDVPLDARTDSYVIETHVAIPNDDVRLLFALVITALKAARKALEAHNFTAYEIDGWRQLRHLIISLSEAYLRSTAPRIGSRIQNQY